MRTTITLDDDVVALVESERQRTGESFRVVVNRLLRRSARGATKASRSALPTRPGQPVLDVTDVSRLVSILDSRSTN